ncbi:hypothetical protein SSP24_52410 [Streptomyces spinoverrucosus]|uniref:Septum formation-related domain-containing protein n=1 Tax=Streptomyces spinoverrucosus TaxID=284043 RepID=A0A4Y3VRK8_9ACTN|nr:hypothetical protein [Streptomyces spinoverrucosus]GEC07586.1 hypothetical protein SSP24_52410 [Streptomyces spinoverrucosus]GHB63201.1 hypothetical protein GCM10010397_36580 [Streptomyces spinoverrucosus]
MTTPPPQGNPFAQGQNPYAQGQPQTPVPPEQPRRKPSFKTIKNVVIVIAVLTVAIGGYIASRDDADQAAVGDCLKSTSSSSDRMEVVECTSAEAEAKVVKKIDGHYSEVTAETECRKVEEATGFYAETGDGAEFLLCLGDV